MDVKEEWVIGCYDDETDTWEWYAAEDELYDDFVQDLDKAKRFIDRSKACREWSLSVPVMPLSVAKAIEAKWKNDPFAEYKNMITPMMLEPTDGSPYGKIVFYDPKTGTYSEPKSGRGNGEDE